MKSIYFTVTNDLTYDQRMHRICHSLSVAGYKVTLVGRKLKDSIPIEDNLSFHQKRISCLFTKGLLFYAEYNLRLFFFLIFQPLQGICAIDLDTILPVFLVSLIRRVPRIYDAHEYFTELKEVKSRPAVQSIWKTIEKLCVPRFTYGYTVAENIAGIFNREYHRNFITIRNLPWLQPQTDPGPHADFIIYQGAVNQARSFETLIPAMQHLPYKLVICGDGNYMEELKKLIITCQVTDKIELKGMVMPSTLKAITGKAVIGLCLSEKEGLNQFFALPNKFFDYMHALVPQVAMNFPEYKAVNDLYRVALLIDDTEPGTLIKAISRLMEDEGLRNSMKEQCNLARKTYCWQEEEKKLIAYYHKIFYN